MNRATGRTADDHPLAATGHGAHSGGMDGSPLPGSAPGPGDRTTDLEYDLAHEPDAPAARRPAPPPRVQVTTETRGYEGGDYGYDLAHDIPRPARPTGAPAG